MTVGEQDRLRTIAEQIELQTQRLDAVDDTLADLVAEDVVLGRLATVVGPACAAVIGSLVGSPLDFPNARALEKAFGLNLKEKSSGNTRGQMSITKRGPGQCRRSRTAMDYGPGQSTFVNDSTPISISMRGQAQADPSEKLDAIATVAPMRLRSGRFRAPDKLLESLRRSRTPVRPDDR